MGDLVDLGEEPSGGRGRDTASPACEIWAVSFGTCAMARFCGWPTSRRGWVLAAVDIPVAYDENLDKVRRTIEAVAEDMYGDPLYDDMLLGRPTYAGVEAVSGRRCSSRSSPKPHRRSRSHSPGRSGRRSGRFRPRGYPGADGRATLPPGAAGQPPAQ